MENEVQDRPKAHEVPADIFRTIFDKVGDWRDKMRLSLVNRQALAAGTPFLQQLSKRVRRLGRNWHCRTLPAPRSAAVFRVRCRNRSISHPRMRPGQHETRADILEVLMSMGMGQVLEMYLHQATACLRIRKADRMQWGQEGTQTWLVHAKVYMRTWIAVRQSSSFIQDVCMGKAHLQYMTGNMRDEIHQLLSSLFVPQLQVCLRPNPQDINKCVDFVLMSHFQGACLY